MSKNKMSEKEENIQRALGTLPKFEIQIERPTTLTSHARVYVTAPNKEAAVERAIKLSATTPDRGKQLDDTGSPIAWNTDDKGACGKARAHDVRAMAEDDYMIYRFTNTSPEEDTEDDKIDASTLGDIM